MADPHTKLGLYRQQFRQHGHLTVSRDNMEWLFGLAETALDLLRPETDRSLVVVAKADRPPPRLVRLTAEHGRR
jgi:hypothetical protein